LLLYEMNIRIYLFHH